MKSMALKFAASGLALSATTFGCVMNGVGVSPAAASERNNPQASALFEQASRELAQGHLDAAINTLEQTVALSPRDVGYRSMLADAYMKAGRFLSAEATYRDVLSIDPGRTRAGLSLALMQAANGRQQDALAQLERLEGQASPADLGLAYALAGSPQRAIDILEPAAHATGASARVRQNLALAYALGGDWQRSRTIAAQDVSPGELGERMTQWAALAQRNGAADQVASVLGVSPANDPGQPTQLALNAPVASPVIAAAPVQVAAAETAVDIPMPKDAPAPAAAAPASASITYASAEPISVPAPVAAPSPAETAPAATDYAELEQPQWGIDDRGAVELPGPAPEAREVPARVQYAAAAEALTRPDPVIMPMRSRAARSLAMASRIVAAIPHNAPRSSGTGRWVVQLGAFSTAANAERAWQSAERRFGLRDEQPVTMTIDVNGHLLHRVAISGFDKRGDASRYCGSIRARGGECFVRGSEGDSVIRWASRYTRRG